MSGYAEEPTEEAELLVNLTWSVRNYGPGALRGVGHIHREYIKRDGRTTTHAYTLCGYRYNHLAWYWKVGDFAEVSCPRCRRLIERELAKQ